MPDTLKPRAWCPLARIAEDRRRNVVELTDAGQDTLRRATKASDDAERAGCSHRSGRRTRSTFETRHGTS